MSSHKPCKMFIAIFTVVTFLFTSLGISPNAFAVSATPEVSLPYQVAIDRSLGLSIPQELGKIEHFSPGQGNRPAIFHIQTAHGHYEAQQQIREILHYLDKEYGVRTVLVEGSAFQLDPALLNFFPKDQKLTQKVNDALTKQAIVKGPELYLLDKTRDALPAQAFGIESLEAYRENGLAFVDVLTQKGKTSQFLADMNIQIERLASHFLNKELRDFLRRVESFEKNQILLDTWLADLKGEAQKRLEIDLAAPAHQLDWPMMVRLFKVQELSAKLDRQKLPKERDEFLKALRRFLQPATFAEIEQLLTSDQVSRELPDPETELLFEDMAERLPENFNYEAFPNVRSFIGILLLQSELKADRLMLEVPKLSNAIAEKLARTTEEKQLVALLADHRLLQKLFALELAPEDYEAICVRRKAYGARGQKLEEQNAGEYFSIKPSRLISAMQDLGVQDRRTPYSVLRTKSVEFKHLAELDQLFDAAMKFYSGVKERDVLMMQRVEERLKETGAKKVAVITGGFHSEPFHQYFASHQNTYALISPKLASADEPGHEAYVRNMLQFGRRATKETDGATRNVRRATEKKKSLSVERNALRAKEATIESVFVSDAQVPDGTNPYGVNQPAMRAEIRKIVSEVAGRTSVVAEGNANQSRSETRAVSELDIRTSASVFAALLKAYDVLNMYKKDAIVIKYLRQIAFFMERPVLEGSKWPDAKKAKIAADLLWSADGKKDERLASVVIEQVDFGTLKLYGDRLDRSRREAARLKAHWEERLKEFEKSTARSEMRKSPGKTSKDLKLPLPVLMGILEVLHFSFLSSINAPLVFSGFMGFSVLGGARGAILGVYLAIAPAALLALSVTRIEGMLEEWALRQDNPRILPLLEKMSSHIPKDIEVEFGTPGSLDGVVANGEYVRLQKRIAELRDLFGSRSEARATDAELVQGLTAIAAAEDYSKARYAKMLKKEIERGPAEGRGPYKVARDAAEELLRLDNPRLEVGSEDQLVAKSLVVVGGVGDHAREAAVAALLRKTGVPMVSVTSSLADITKRRAEMRGDGLFELPSQQKGAEGKKVPVEKVRRVVMALDRMASYPALLESAYKSAVAGRMTGVSGPILEQIGFMVRGTADEDVRAIILASITPKGNEVTYRRLPLIPSFSEAEEEISPSVSKSPVQRSSRRSEEISDAVKKGPGRPKKISEPVKKSPGRPKKISEPVKKSPGRSEKTPGATPQVKAPRSATDPIDRLMGIIKRHGVYSDQEIADAIEALGSWQKTLLIREEHARADLFMKVIGSKSYGPLAQVEALKQLKMPFIAPEDMSTMQLAIVLKIHAAILAGLDSPFLKVRNEAIRAASRFMGVFARQGISSFPTRSKERSELRTESGEVATVRAEVRTREILFSAMESGYPGTPKSGGEFDYNENLPPELVKLGQKVRLVTPNFGRKITGGRVTRELAIPLGLGSIQINIREVEHKGVTYQFLEDPSGALFTRLYNESDKLRGVVEAAVLALATIELGKTADLLHVNDWQAGLVPVYADTTYQKHYGTKPVVYISHNMAYKGMFDYEMPIDLKDDSESKLLAKLENDGVLQKGRNLLERDGKTLVALVNRADPAENIFNLPASMVTATADHRDLEYHGKLTLGKGFLRAAMLSAVSETNLEEMALDENEGGAAFGFEGGVQQMSKAGKTAAVFNGGGMNPETEPALQGDGYTNFKLEDVIQAHAVNKPALLHQIQSWTGMNKGSYKFVVDDLKGDLTSDSFKGNGLSAGWDQEKLEAIRGKHSEGGVVTKEAWAEALNQTLESRMRVADYQGIQDNHSLWAVLDHETKSLLAKVLKSPEDMSEMEFEHLNRRLLEAIYPQQIERTSLKIQVYGGDLRDLSVNEFKKDFLIGSVGRFTPQKGFDDIDEATLEALRKTHGPHGERVHLVFLGAPGRGSADDAVVLEHLLELANKYPDVLTVLLGFDTKLANRLYSALDAFFMPSRFEPAGIAQQIANMLGTLVIAPLVGGLKDFFLKWKGVGFSYTGYSRKQPEQTRREATASMLKAADIFWNQPDEWHALMKQAVQYDGSWGSRAAAYIENIYEPLIRKSRSKERSELRTESGEIATVRAEVRQTAKELTSLIGQLQAVAKHSTDAARSAEAERLISDMIAAHRVQNDSGRRLRYVVEQIHQLLVLERATVRRSDVHEEEWQRRSEVRQNSKKRSFDDPWEGKSLLETYFDVYGELLAIIDEHENGGEDLTEVYSRILALQEALKLEDDPGLRRAVDSAREFLKLHESRSEIRGGVQAPGLENEDSFWRIVWVLGDIAREGSQGSAEAFSLGAELKKAKDITDGGQALRKALVEAQRFLATHGVRSEARIVGPLTKRVLMVTAVAAMVGLAGCSTEKSAVQTPPYGPPVYVPGYGDPTRPPAPKIRVPNVQPPKPSKPMTPTVPPVLPKPINPKLASLNNSEVTARAEVRAAPSTDPIADRFEIIPADEAQLDEVLQVHNETWAENENEYLIFNKDVMRNLIRSKRVYLFRDKEGAQTIRGVQLIYPMKTGGNMKLIEDVPLWDNMIEGRESEGSHDTVFFWAIGVPKGKAVPEVNLGQVFAKLAVQHFSKTYLYVSTFSPIKEKDFNKFKEELAAKGVASEVIEKYGIYLYLASTPGEGPWSYVNFIRQYRFVSPEQFFKVAEQRYRDLVENFHVGKNEAKILAVWPQKAGFTRPDGSFTVSYGYGPNEGDYAGFRTLTQVPLPSSTRSEIRSMDRRKFLVSAIVGLVGVGLMAAGCNLTTGVEETPVVTPTQKYDLDHPQNVPLRFKGYGNARVSGNRLTNNGSGWASAEIPGDFGGGKGLRVSSHGEGGANGFYITALRPGDNKNWPSWRKKLSPDTQGVILDLPEDATGLVFHFGSDAWGTALNPVGATIVVDSLELLNPIRSEMRDDREELLPMGRFFAALFSSTERAFIKRDDAFFLKKGSLAVDYLAKKLRARSDSDKIYAADLLAKIKDPSAIPALAGVSHSEKAMVRLAVTHAIQAITDVSRVGNFRELREKTPDEIRRLMAVPALIETLGSESEEARGEAFDELGRISDPSVVFGLTKILEETKDASTLDRVIGILGQKGDFDAVPALLRVAGSRNPNSVRQVAIRALGMIGASSPSPLSRILAMPLAMALSDRDEGIREEAAKAFAGIPYPAEIIPKLVGRLGDARDVRIAAAKALSTSDDPRLKPLQTYFDWVGNRRGYYVVLAPEMIRTILAALKEGKGIEATYAQTPAVTRQEGSVIVTEKEAGLSLTSVKLSGAIGRSEMRGGLKKPEFSVGGLLIVSGMFAGIASVAVVFVVPYLAYRGVRRGAQFLKGHTFVALSGLGGIKALRGLVEMTYSPDKMLSRHATHVLLKNRSALMSFLQDSDDDIFDAAASLILSGVKADKITVKQVFDGMESRDWRQLPRSILAFNKVWPGIWYTDVDEWISSLSWRLEREKAKEKKLKSTSPEARDPLASVEARIKALAGFIDLLKNHPDVLALERASRRRSEVRVDLPSIPEASLSQVPSVLYAEHRAQGIVLSVTRWFRAGILPLRVMLSISYEKAVALLERLGIRKEEAVKFADHLTAEEMWRLEVMSAKSLAVSQSQSDKTLAGGTVFMDAEGLVSFAKNDSPGFYRMLNELAEERLADQASERPIITAGDFGTTARIAQVLLNKNSGVTLGKAQMLKLLDHVIKVQPVKGSQAVTINELAAGRPGGMVTVLSSDEMLAGLNDGANFAFKDRLAKENVKLVLRSLLGRMRALATQLEGASASDRVKLLEEFNARRVGGPRKVQGGFVFDNVLLLVQSFLSQERATAKSA